MAAGPSMSRDTVAPPAADEGTGARPRRRTPPRRMMIAASAVLGVALAVVAALLPVPYVLLTPGPTTNTLGEVDGEELIVIEGRRTYPTGGRLDLTTVKVRGGPDRTLDLASALRGWVDPTMAVVPVEQVYPRGESQDEIRQRNVEEMNLSQVNAAAAALQALDIPVTEVVVVQAILEGSPARGVLQAADVVTAVDGRPVTTPEQVRDAVRAREPGAQVTITVERDGRTRTETLTTRESPEQPGQAVVGFVPDVSFEFPFDVTFSLEDVGGPSAGMMFALGIIDKLTPGQATGGAYVAGTGTITPDGTVGGIGGIQQKLVAARERDVDLFLAPEANCRQVAAATPEGLRVAKVATLDEAVAALEALRAGRADTVPGCTA
jgi:Lon-like protease